ncbi:unnamed protein product [Prorocentrum cordatum]|uniref:Uncharacterized protein n=1 Tax=Prorocentrum cordatum TaxID=2364126 RepID=A0ABN9WTL6_9DINO|nr:unnamed protein product [Polarella glacialis]
MVDETALALLAAAADPSSQRVGVSMTGRFEVPSLLRVPRAGSSNIALALVVPLLLAACTALPSRRAGAAWYRLSPLLVERPRDSAERVLVLSGDITQARAWP